MFVQFSLGDQRILTCTRSICPWWLVSEIFEVYSNTKVATAQELNDSLQLVFLFSSDANLAVLQLALHLESLRLDRLNDFLGLVPFETLLDLQFLPCMTDR